MRESQSESIDVADVIEELDALEETVSDDIERADVQRVRRMVERVPGSEQIHKYTSRDVGEAFVGALLFSLPLLVEDGVFDIAAWFTTTVGPARRSSSRTSSSSSRSRQDCSTRSTSGTCASTGRSSA